MFKLLMLLKSLYIKLSKKMPVYILKCFHSNINNFKTSNNNKNKTKQCKAKQSKNYIYVSKLQDKSFNHLFGLNICNILCHPASHAKKFQIKNKIPPLFIGHEYQQMQQRYHHHHCLSNLLCIDKLI